MYHQDTDSKGVQCTIVSLTNRLIVGKGIYYIVTTAHVSFKVPGSRLTNSILTRHLCRFSRMIQEPGLI